MENKIYLTERAKRVIELFDQGKVKEAQAFFDSERTKEGSSDVCHSQDTSYSDADRAQILKELYKEALSGHNRPEKNGPTVFDPVIADIFINLAVIYNDAGHLGEAEILYREALSIYRRLNKEKPFTRYGLALAAACNLLALLYTDTGRKKEAKELYEESLSVCRSMEKTAHDIFEKYIMEIRIALNDL